VKVEKVRLRKEGINKERTLLHGLCGGYIRIASLTVPKMD
jgi:hypothetical protein